MRASASAYTNVSNNPSKDSINTTSANAVDHPLGLDRNLPADHPLRDDIRRAAHIVRDTTPLAQSFTNFVTINLVANAQLAAGGTAAMSFLPDDIMDIAAIAGATYINVGTLLPFYAEALPDIARRLHEASHRWVLDPVAAGLGATRTAILQSFAAVPPTVVRGNASELLALSTLWGLDDHADNTGPVGVDAADEVDASLEAAVRVARHLTQHSADGLGAVAVSGARDLITDGQLVYRLGGGNPMMTKITGAGCALGGVVGTYLAVADPLVAAVAASAHFNLAGSIAARHAQGPGSFQTAFLDALWQVTADDIANADITCVDVNGADIAAMPTDARSA